jgi:protein gp37
MGRQSSIAWTEATLNLVYGCFKIDTDPLLGGCVHCYALDRVLPRMGKPAMPLGFPDLQKRIKELRSWHDVTIIFVNSLSDTFHESIPFALIERWHKEVFEAFPDKQFLLLTKRIGRAEMFYRNRPVPKNVWVGTSIGQKARLWRLDKLRQIKANNLRLYGYEPIVFGSLEPLLEDLGDFNAKGIDWLIVGGESDFHNPRPMKPEWAENVRRIAERDGAAFFFKQAGGRGGGGAGGSMLNGKEYRNWPDF